MWQPAVRPRPRGHGRRLAKPRTRGAAQRQRSFSCRSASSTMKCRQRRLARGERAIRVAPSSATAPDTYRRHHASTAADRIPDRPLEMANRATLRPTCTPPAHASVGSNETSEARGDGWAWTFQPPSRANTCILASAHGTPSSTRTSKRGEASRRSSAGRLMKACRSAAATVPSHASALSRPPTTGMRSYSARAAPGRMRGGCDHEASHRAHHRLTSWQWPRRDTESGQKCPFSTF